MPLPEEADAPETAPMYRYFEQFEGIRLYYRAKYDAEIDYLRAWFTPSSDPSLDLMDAQDDAELLLSTRIGGHYAIEHSTDMESWSEIATDINGDGLIVRHRLGALTEESGFYRLRLVEMDTETDIETGHHSR